MGSYPPTGTSSSSRFLFGVESRAMKLLAAIFACVALALSYFLYEQHTQIIAQRDLIAKIGEVSSAKEKHSSRTNTMEDQGRCAAQAKKTFEESGYKPKDMAGYENHYNARLDKCFLLIRSTDTSYTPTIWTHVQLMDAFEGKSFGEYDWHTMKDKKFWEVPPAQCRVVIESGEETFCKSEDEFKNLISDYMSGS